MKREIKFRALKDDMSNCNFVYGQLVYDAIGIPRISAVDISGKGLKFHTCLHGTEGQYIGLKDKNGKEIYEGDIIINKNASPPEDGGFIVKFVGFEWIAYNINFQNEPYCSIGFSSIISERFEVIGNIHEHPELLK